MDLDLGGVLGARNEVRESREAWGLGRGVGNWDCTKQRIRVQSGFLRLFADSEYDR